jgi:hypothetical protein
MSSGFIIRDTISAKNVIVENVSTISASTQSLLFPSVQTIPSSGNVIYTMNGTLYYKSSAGTITVLASN